MSKVTLVKELMEKTSLEAFFASFIFATLLMVSFAFITTKDVISADTKLILAIIVLFSTMYFYNSVIPKLNGYQSVMTFSIILSMCFMKLLLTKILFIIFIALMILDMIYRKRIMRWVDRQLVLEQLKKMEVPQCSREKVLSRLAGNAGVRNSRKARSKT